jgi:hypothetical protein
VLPQFRRKNVDKKRIHAYVHKHAYATIIYIEWKFEREKDNDKIGMLIKRWFNDTAFRGGSTLCLKLKKSRFRNKYHRLKLPLIGDMRIFSKIIFQNVFYTE